MNISDKFNNGPNRPQNGPVRGQLWNLGKHIIFGHCKVIFGPRAFKIGTNGDLYKQYNINSVFFRNVKTEFHKEIFNDFHEIAHFFACPLNK